MTRLHANPSELAAETAASLPSSVDVVVVGAGIGGLSAAIVAGAAGLRVLVVDRLPTPGGKCNIAVHEGVEFDTGPSVITLTAELDAVFRAAGTTLGEHVTVFEPSPAFRYHWPDKTVLDIFAQWPDSLASIRHALGEPAAADAQRYASYAERIWNAAAPHFVRGPAPTPLTMARLALRHPGAVLAIDPFSRMQGGIERRVKSPYLRDLFSRYATYNGSDVRTAPATLNCIAHVELGLGGFGVQGGLYELVRAMVRVATQTGVTFALGTGVARILTQQGRAVGVTLENGTTISAGSVVSNVDGAHLQRLLGKSIRRRGTPSMSGYNLLVRARRRHDRPAHAVLFPTTYGNEFRDIFDRSRPPQEPTVYLCAQEKAHRRLGWADHEPLFVMANTPAMDPSEWSAATWLELKSTVWRRLIEAGLLDADDTVVWERNAVELAQQFPDSLGSIYGAASNDPMAAFRRLPNQDSRVRGLFHAGGSAHPGGGVPLCAMSGRAAAEQLLVEWSRSATSRRLPAGGTR